MNLEIDMGNTRLKWRLWRGNKIIEHNSAKIAGINEAFNLFQIKGLDKLSIVSVSSDKLVASICESARQLNPGLRIFIAKTQLFFGGVTCGYEDPSQLGADRWLAYVQAFNLCQCRCCVIDIGTAITVDWVSDKGKHLGGLIVPGYKTMEDALLAGTKKVRYNMQKTTNVEFTGSNTFECVRYGVDKMVYSFVRYVLYEHPFTQNSKVFITGGGAKNLISSLLKNYEYAPSLVLDGLRLVSLQYFKGLK